MQVIVMQHRNWAKVFFIPEWKCDLTSLIPEKLPSNHYQYWFFFQAKMHVFLYFDFLAPFRIRDTIVAEFPVELQSTRKKNLCSRPVSALQTFVSHRVPRACPTSTTVKRRIMFTLFYLVQILPGQKFSACLEELSVSTDRIQIFF